MDEDILLETKISNNVFKYKKKLGRPLNDTGGPLTISELK